MVARGKRWVEGFDGRNLGRHGGREQFGKRAVREREGGKTSN